MIEAVETPASLVSLSYSQADHEFQLEVQQVSKVTYLLEYLSQNQDEKKIRHAINKSGQADDNQVFSEKILAGTESNSDQFFHDVVSGNLKLIITLPDQTRKEHQLEFEIEEGELKVTTQGSKVLSASESGQVLGEATQSAAATKPEPQVFQPVANTKVTHPEVQTPWYQKLTDFSQFNQALPLIIGIGLFISILAAVAIYHSKRSLPPGLNKKLS